MKHASSKAGFTMIELLAVIVIIGILGGLGMGGYAHFIKQAKQKNAADLCEQVKTAWTSYHRNVGFWPDRINQTGVQEMTPEMCAILGKEKLLDVLYIDDDNQQNNGLKKNRDQEPELKYGLLDPFGKSMAKGSGRANDIKDHLIQFVIDANEDGIVDASDGMPSALIKNRKIRGDVAVWCWPEDVKTGKAEGEAFAKSW